MDPLAAATLGGALVGAIASFAGTCAGLVVTNKQHLSRLIAEDKRAEREREFSAKKVAFLRASDAFAAVLSFIVTTPDRAGPLTVVHQNAFLELSAAFNGLHFYASIETLEHSVKLGHEVNAALGDVLAAHVKVEQTWHLENGVSKMMESLDSMHEQYNREIVALLPEGQNTEWMLHLRRLRAENRARAFEEQSKLAALVRQRVTASEECRAVMIERVPAVIQMAQKLLVSLRRELGFFIGEHRYIALMDAATQKAFKDAERMVKERHKHAMDLAGLAN